MALQTHSRFWFGFDVDSTNNAIDFSEGGPEIQATVATGSYSATEFVTAVEAAMNNIGGQDYTVTLDRSTRKLTIAAAGNFELLTTTGSRVGTTTYTLMGFSGADKTGTNSYLADSETGSEYTTQFKLQDYRPSRHSQRAADAVVNKAASGRIEVVKFGQEKFINASFKWITDYAQTANSKIRNRPNGVDDFLTFLEFAITKAPIEFMPDEDDQNTFEKVILESAPGSGKGVGFNLTELVGQGLAGWYELTGVKFRVID